MGGVMTAWLLFEGRKCGRGGVSAEYQRVDIVSTAAGGKGLVVEVYGSQDRWTFMWGDSEQPVVGDGGRLIENQPYFETAALALAHVDQLLVLRGWREGSLVVEPGESEDDRPKERISMQRHRGALEKERKVARAWAKAAVESVARRFGKSLSVDQVDQILNASRFEAVRQVTSG